MKKLVYSGLMFLALQSCLGNDKDENAETSTEAQTQQTALLVAEKWQVTQASVTIDLDITVQGMSMPYEVERNIGESEFGCQNDMLFQFIEGGTFNFDKAETYCSPSEEINIDDYRWSMNAEATVLTIKGDMAGGAVGNSNGITSLGDEADYVIVKLTNEELVLQRTLAIDEIMDEEVLATYEMAGAEITGTAEVIATYLAKD